jgi:hypothetical protein
MFLRKSLISICFVAYINSIAGCGVLLYPERQGQKGGRIDPAVAILDGIGLLFFVIPGLIAFAIDFHQGTIYLSGGRHGSLDSDTGLRAVKVNGPMTEENIEATIKTELGQSLDITAFNVQAMHITQEQLQLMSGYAQARSTTL